MATPREFRRQLRQANIRLNTALTTGIRRAAGELRLEIAQATPFDTGRAAGSWNVSEGGPNRRVLPPEVRFSTRDAAARAGEDGLADFRIGFTIYISNSLPYVPALNAGSSRQAPSNFIEMTMQEFPFQEIMALITEANL